MQFGPRAIVESKIHPLFQEDEVTFPYNVTGLKNHTYKYTKGNKETSHFP